jgi:hypothetical protein
MEQEKINRLAKGSIQALASLDAMEVIELAKAHLKLQEFKKAAELGNCYVEGIGGRKWVFVPESDVIPLYHLSVFKAQFDRLAESGGIKDTWQFVQAVREEAARILKTVNCQL